MKKFVKIMFCFSMIFSIIAFSGVFYYSNVIDNNLYVSIGAEPNLSPMLSLSEPEAKENSMKEISSNQKTKRSIAKLSLAGIIPIKTVGINRVEPKEVVVIGTPFGAKIYSEGVMIIGMTDVDTKSGKTNPAAIAGLKTGDMILTVNGKKIQSNEQLAEIVNNSNGEKLLFKIKRDDKKFETLIKPEFCETDNSYKIGIWIRDSCAGIGMLTFYDPQTKILAGLGHGICDQDTGKLVPIDNGKILDAQILSYKKGTVEKTGELSGCFGTKIYGDLLLNDITGVFGECTATVDGQVMPIAYKNEIKKETAQILTTIDGTVPQLYDCQIEKINLESDSLIKNIVIKITDKKLLETTGGIVQGVSGSPIIQNGKLIGAVTHVLIDDPTKGYGIFAENMLSTAQSIAEQKLKEAS